MAWLKDIHYAVYDGEDPIAIFSYTKETEHLYMGNSLITGYRYRALSTEEYETFMAFELVPVVGPEEYSKL